MSEDSISWNIIHKYFEEDNYRLTQHHLQSYSDLIRHKIPKVIASQKICDANVEKSNCGILHYEN